jgi:hypothetical protein
LQASERGILLENGEIALSGSSADLAADPTIVERYLGQFRTEHNPSQSRAASLAWSPRSGSLPSRSSRGESLKAPRATVPRLVFAAFTNVFAWMGFSSLRMKW